MKKRISVHVTLIFLIVIGAAILFNLVLMHVTNSEFIGKGIIYRLENAVYTVHQTMDLSDVNRFSPTSQKSRSYRDRWMQLRGILQYNGLTHLYVMVTNATGRFAFVYATADNPDVRVVRDNDGKEQYLDATTGEPRTVSPGVLETDVFLKEYLKPPPELIRILKVKTDRPVRSAFYRDEFGEFRSVFLPVYDDSGGLVCVIGADYDHKAFFSALSTLIVANVLSILILVGIGFFFRQYFLRRFVRPLEEIGKGVRLAANRVLNYRIRVETDDELGELARNLNLMNEKLGESFQKIEEYNKKLMEELFEDRLTGLPNRRKFFDDLQRFRDPVIIMINIDSFHEINDFYGSETGDFILVEMARRLKSLCLGSYYHLYKMSADQYSIVVDEEMGRSGMEILGIYFSEGVMDYPFIYNRETEIFVSISIGIGRLNKSGFDQNSRRYRMALANADRALKQARTLKKKFVVFNEELEANKEYQNNIEWSRKIKKAIREDRIVPYFQPIINNRTGAIEKYECLVRLVDEDGKIVLPYYFLGVAKSARLYRYITKIMVDKTFSFFSRNNFEFSLNLSVEDIMDEKTVAYILGKLNEYDGIGNRVVFEFLETENIEEYAEVKEFVDRVRAKGCRIAIDDFGTGYSNFAHIVHLNVDYIKIDSSLIKNINQDRNSLIITKTIANFARELGMKTISEFVHCKEVFEECVKLDIDFSQGFYLGEPRAVLADGVRKDG